MVPLIGLKLIPERALLDLLTLSFLLFVTVTEASMVNAALLLACCLLTLATAGLTNRWTLSFPLVLFVLCQVLRRLSSNIWVSYLLGTLSTLLVLLSAVLSVLFPPIELPPVQGPYDVGIIRTFLPRQKNDRSTNNGSTSTSDIQDHVAVRILYPTAERSVRLPYLPPETAKEFCASSMKFGAPPALQNFGWMLHNWMLMSIRGKPHATLVAQDKPFPVIVYSHGLMGTAEVYSYQTMHLAAQGYVVVVITHSDQSASVAHSKLGNTISYNFDLVHDDPAAIHAGKRIPYVQGRRQQANHRVEEIRAVAQEGLDWVEQEYSHLGFVPQRTLDRNAVLFMGHSFGGATVLTAATRYPLLIKGVIAHEPALDWMPDDARKAFFHKDKLQAIKEHNYTKGSGGYASEDYPKELQKLHQINMLILFSWEWRQEGWAWSETVERMHQQHLLGGPVSDVAVIDQAHHQEFSDSCMLTPLWLARSNGLTGSRPPEETAKEIHQRTMRFLDELQSHLVEHEKK